MTHGLLLFLHVLSVAVWMGAALWVAGDVKRALGLGRPYLEALPPRVGAAFAVDLGAGVAVLVTGLLILLEMHVTRPRVGLTVGIVAALARMGVLALMRGAWRGLAARLAAGELPPVTDPAARRLAMLSGIAHTCWLVALAGMVFPV